MYTQDAMPFLYGILQNQIGGNKSRSGRFYNSDLKCRDHQMEIYQIGGALCMNEFETIATLVYFRTMIHNLIYASISGKSSALDAGHIYSLKSMAQWLDGNIDVFMSLPEEVAEFKDGIVSVNKPLFLSDRLKERVDFGVQSSCKINITSMGEKVSSRSNLSAQRNVTTQKAGYTSVNETSPQQMMQMADDLCESSGSTLTMAAPGSQRLGSYRQMQWG